MLTQGRNIIADVDKTDFTGSSGDMLICVYLPELFGIDGIDIVDIVEVAFFC